MRIAFDLSPVLGKKTGVEYYALRLYAEMKACVGEDGIVPFSNHPVPEIPETVVLNQSFPGFAWRQFLPLRFKRYGITSHHSPVTAVPYFSSVPTFATVHDMCFLQSADSGDLKCQLRACKMAVKHCRNVICVSDATRKALCANIQAEYVSKCVTVHSGALLRMPKGALHSGDSDYACRHGEKNATFNGLERTRTDSNGQAPVRAVPGYVGGKHYRCCPANAGDELAMPTQHPRGRIGVGVPLYSASGIFLQIGRIDKRKNPLLVLNAFAESGIADNFYFVFAGPFGDASADVELWLEKHPQIASRVICTGYLSEERLADLLQSASALVYPSLDEGFGHPPFEALASGVLPIVSDIPVLHETLGNNSAFFVPLNDVSAWAKAFQMVADGSATDIATILDAGQKRIAQLTWRRTAETIITLHQQAI